MPSTEPAKMKAKDRGTCMFKSILRNWIYWASTVALAAALILLLTNPYKPPVILAAIIATAFICSWYSRLLDVIKGAKVWYGILMTITIIMQMTVLLCAMGAWQYVHGFTTPIYVIVWVTISLNMLNDFVKLYDLSKAPQPKHMLKESNKKNDKNQA